LSLTGHHNCRAIASNRSLGNIIRKSREDYRALKNNGVGGLLDVGGEKPEQAAAVF